MRRRPAGLRLALLGALAASAAGAQVDLFRLLPPGDKTFGEEEQIRARVDWFRRVHALERVARPDRLRQAAIAETRARIRATRIPVSWEPLGPEGMTMLNWTMGTVAGRIDALAVDPGDENVLYLGAASGGLWKSTDGGANWTILSDDLGTQSIGAITLEPGDAQSVWVGTGEHVESCTGYFGIGLIHSADGGATWETRNGGGAATLDLSYIAGVIVHPGNPQLVLAGGHAFCTGGGQLGGGIFRSLDRGATWSQVLTGEVDDLIYDPSAPDTMYAAVGDAISAASGVYKSIDAGATWVQLDGANATWTPDPGNLGRVRIALAPSAPQTLYALVNRTAKTWLYQSTNGGATWTQTNSDACEGQCWYDLCVAVDPTSPATVLVGSIRFARSTNSGGTLNYLTTSWGGAQKVHQDTHVLVYSRTNGSRFWVGSDGGLWRSDNAGGSFANLNAGLQITQYYDVAVDPGTSEKFWGGAQDNSSSCKSCDPNPGLEWDVTEVTGDGFMNLVDPADADTVFQTSYPSGGFPSVLRSTTGGAPNSFSYLRTAGLTMNEPYPWVTPLAILDSGPSSPTYAFLASNFVYRADTAQASGTWRWTKISTSLTGNTTNAVSVIAPVLNAGAVTIYAGTENGRIQRTDNGTATPATWSNVTGNFPGGLVTDVASDPSAPLTVFATRGEFGGAKLYRSTAGGTTWTAVGAGLPDVPANAVAIDPLDPTRIFVADDVGVFVSRDGGDTFQPWMSGLPLGTPVVDLEVDDAPYVLVAGTYGRGAWRLALDSPLLFSDDFESGDTAAWSATTP
ncbi:MAG: hypothetical protein U0X73_06075 [Thermoanaerobaculia bacterium]